MANRGAGAHEGAVSASYPCLARHLGEQTGPGSSGQIAQVSGVQQ